MQRNFRVGQGVLQAVEANSLATGDGALWIDLLRPTVEEAEALAATGVDVPSLTEMEEIEVSNRLYRDEGVEYLTVVLPGPSQEGHQIAGPVTFALDGTRLITVRYFSPPPFDSFANRAGRTKSGCGSAERLLLGLMEEIVGYLADLLEAAGRELDAASHDVFLDTGGTDATGLQNILQQVGRQGESIGRVRLGLLTMERALSFFEATGGEAGVSALIEALERDITALTEHSDHLSARVGLTVDATMGMINLAQNQTVRIFSVVAVLFLPPTLVASIYGMNFHAMPELSQPWGYPASLAAMLASAVGCYLFFKWKKWL